MMLRILAAIPLSYAFAALWAMALARVLPGARSDASLTGSLVALAICALAVMWSFAARSGWRAVWTLLLGAFVAGAIAWTSIAMTGRL